MRGTSLMWAPHVWCCVTDFSSLTALLEYLVTYNITAQSPSPDGKYQLIFNFIKSCQKSLDYAYLIPDRCVIARLCQQTRFIVPVESAGADRVPIVPEDSGSHRHRVSALFHERERRGLNQTKKTGPETNRNLPPCSSSTKVSQIHRTLTKYEHGYLNFIPVQLANSFQP